MLRRRVRTTLGVLAAIAAGCLALTAGGAVANAAGPVAVVAQDARAAVAQDARAAVPAPHVPAPRPSSSDHAEASPGGAPSGHSRGWWKRVYSDHGKPKIDAGTAQDYLDAVAAASDVFPEQTDASTRTAAHAVLSPTGRDPRARATAALLVAWLEDASGAVSDDSPVPLKSGDTTFADLMTEAERVVLDPDATPAELRAVTRDLGRVRHAD